MRIFTFLFFALTASLAFGQSCPADFDFTAVSCNEIEFTPRSNAAGTYEWRFGDGTTSTRKNPTHIFGATDGGSKTYNVTLITGGACVPDTVTRAVTVSPADLPDASIESVGIYNFVNCAPTDDPSYELRILNTSSTKATNVRYHVDWGDGSTPYSGTSLPDFTGHTYTSVGLYDIVLSVQGPSGCWAQETFEFFYGSNPGGNIVPVSNQIACVPENVEFIISGTGDNPPGTIYKIWVNDGSGDTTYFNHPPPTNFSYYLTTSPCESDETSDNYFNIYFEATNPCFTQSGGTIIRANKAPEMDFDADDVACEGGVIEIRNNSEPALYAVGNTCSFEMLTEWSINADPSKYDIVGGSLNDENGLDIVFNEAGEYVITLNYTPRYSNACTSPPMSQTICILPEPEASYRAVNAEPESCSPLTLDVKNTSNTLATCGREATYEWIVEYVPGECGDESGDYTVLEGSGKGGLFGRDLKIQFESAGVYRLGLKTTNECGEDTYWEEYVVADAPVVSIEEIDDVCFDGPITVNPLANISLDCTDPPAFTWDFDGGTGGDVTALDPGPVTYNAPGVYTIRLRVSNSCGTTVVTETFEIADAPAVPEITVTEEACEQTEIVATLAGSADGLTFAWTGPDRFTSDQAEWTIRNARPKNAGTYTVVVTNAVGCTSTETFEVQVNPSAPITVEGGDVDVCIGEDVTLTVTGGDTYTWTGDHINATTGSSVVFNHDVPGVYTIVVLGTDPAGLCDATDEIKVTVHDLPVAEAGADQVACAGETLNLRGEPFSIDGKGEWTGDFVTAEGEFNAPAAGTYTLTYTYTNAGGCSDSDEMTVCVREAPVANFTLPEAAGCMPAGLTLRPENLSSAVSDCDAATMTWTLTAQKSACFSGSVAYVEGTDENSFAPVIEISEAGNYLLTLTVSSSCGESTHTEKVMVGETPEMTIVPIDTLCGPQTVTMQTRGGYCDVSTTTYQWDMPTATPPATFDKLKPDPVFFGEGKHTVILTSTNFCGTYVVEETFVVAGNAVVDLDVSSDQLCLNGTRDFTVSNNNVGDFESYAWTVYDPAGAVFATSTETAPTFSFGAGATVGTYDVEAIMAVAGCSDIVWDTTVVVGTTPDPSINEIVVDCGQDRFTPVADFGGAPELIQSVSWTFPAGSTPATSTELEPGEVILGTYGTDLEVTLTVVSACGTTTVTETFDVIQPTVVDITFDKTSLCEGETVTVTNNSTGSGLTYNWSVSPAAGVTISDPTAAAPTLTFNGGMGDFTVTATIGNGICADETFTQVVKVGTLPVITVDPVADACDRVRLQPSVTYGIDEALIDSVRWIVTRVSGPDAGTEIYNGKPWNKNLDVEEVGDYVFTAVAYNGCAPAGATGEAAFSVLDGPPVTFDLDTDRICSGASITVTNTSDITKGPKFFVYDADGNEVASGGKSPFTFTYDAGLAPGAYTIRLELQDKRCGTGSGEATVYLLGDPEVVLDPIPDGCGTATVNLTATHTDAAQLSGIGWEIRNAGGSVVYTDATFAPAAALLPPGDYTARVTVTNECSSVSDEQTFTVVPGATASFDLSATDACQGGTITATNTTAGMTDVRFVLLDAAGTEIAALDGSSVTFDLDASYPAGTYTVRLEGNSADCGGGLLSTQTDFSLTPGPAVSLQPVADACGSITFTPAATVTNASAIRYSILNAGRLEVYADETFDPAAVTLGIGTYELTATVTGSCGSVSDVVTFQVTGGITPTVDLDTDATCAGGTFTVTNTSADVPDPTFTVLDASGSAVATSTASPFTFGGDLPAGDYVLRMTGTSLSCGGSVELDTPITVGERPTIAVDPVADACGSITFTPSGSWTLADAIVWEVRNAAGAVVYSDATFTPSPANLPAGSYTLSGSVQNGCGNATDAVTFMVGGDPASTVTFTLDRDITCEGGSITATNTSTGLSNVTFTIIDRYGNGIQQQSGNSLTFGGDLPAGDYTVRMTGESDACSGAAVSKDAPVTIEAAPRVVLDAVADQCGEVTLVPSARFSDANVVEWSIRNTAGAIVYTDASFTPAAVTLGPGFYTLIVEVANNCGIADDATTFEVTGGITPQFTLTSELACAGTTITAVNTTADLVNLRFSVRDASGTEVATSPVSPFTFGSDLPVGEYTVRMEGSSASCPTGTVATEQVVAFNTTPTVTLAPVADACGSLSFTPAATTTYATEIRWELVDTEEGAVLFTDNTFEAGLITLGPGRYELQATVRNDCNTATDRTTFTVEAPEPATLSLDTDDVCAGETITVRNTSTGLEEVRYNVINESGFTVASGGGASFTFGTGLAAGNYRVVLTGNRTSCSGAPVSVDTTVSLRAKPFIKLDDIASNCGSITFAPTADYTNAVGIIWSIRNAGGVEVYRDNTFDPATVTLAPGFYTLTGVVFNECGTDDDVTTFEVGDGTEPTFALDTELVCEGGTFTVTNTTTDLSNLRFIVLDGTGATVATSTTSPFTFGGGFPTGTYTVRMEGNSFSCSPDLVSQEAEVDVVNAPTVTVDPVAEACGASEFVPSATTAFASEIRWTILDGRGVTVYTDDRFVPQVAVLPAGDYTLVAAVSNDCGNAEDRTTFTVNPGPTANFSLSSSSVCSGGSIVATNRSTGDVDNFVFEVIDASGAVVLTSDASPATFTFGSSLPVGTYTVRLTVSSATCAPVSNSTEVTLGVTPFIDLAPLADQCAPATVTLSATHTPAEQITFINWQIRDETGKLVYNNDTFDPLPADLEEGTYFVTATVANNCGVDRSRDTFRLTTGAMPLLTLDTDVNCAGEFFTAGNGNPEITDVTFSVLDAAGTTVTSGTTVPFVFGDDLAAGTYTLRLEGSSATCGGSAAIDTLITVGASATVTVDPVADACGSVSFVPGATVTDALSMSWTITDATGATVYTDDTFTPATADLGPGSYTLTARVSNDCGDDTDAVTFTVTAPEPATFAVSADDICEKQTITVTSTSSGLDNLIFRVRNEAGIVVATGTASPFTFGKSLPGGTYTVTMEGDRADCAGITVSVDAVVNIRPVPTVALETLEGQCGSYTFTPAAVTTEATSIGWSIRNAAGTVVYTDNSFTPAAVTLGPGFYTLTVDVANDCGIAKDLTTFEVTTGTPPTFDLSATDVCAGASITVTNTTADMSDLSFVVRDAAGASVATGTSSPFTFGTDLAPGTYTVRMEGKSGSCPNEPVALEADVTITTVPGVAVDPVADACGSVTFVPAASTTDASRIDWTLTDAAGTELYTFSGFAPGQVTVGPGSYTLTAEVGNDCGDATDAVTFTVSDGDEPTFALDRDENCAGGTFTATGTTASLAGVTFTVTDAAGATVAYGRTSPFTFGATLPAGTYTVRMSGFATDCGDAPVATEQTITVQPDPKVDVAAIAGTCGSLTLTPAADHQDATGIDWKIRNGSGTLVYTDDTFAPAEVTLGPGFYTLVVEVSNECGIASDFTTFEITTGDPATFSLDTDDICTGESVTVTNTSTDLSDLSFTVTDAMGTVVATGSASPFTFGSDLPAGAYTVRMEGRSTTCASGIIGTETSVLVKTVPTVAISPVATEWCGAADFTPEATVTFADAISWTVRTADGKVVYTDATFRPADVDLPAGSYTLEAVVSNDCATASDAVAFTVSPAPIANFSLSSSTACAGGSITATNLSSGAYDSFTFTVLDADWNVVLTSTESPATFTFGEDFPVGEYIVRLELNSATCAPASNSTRISVGAGPSIVLDPQADLCGPNNVQLSATYSDPAGINFINWQIRDASGQLVFNSDAFAPPVASLLEGTYHVTATVANGCGVVRSRDTFELYEAPRPSFTVDSEIACQGGTLTVTNTSGGDVTDFTFSLIDPLGTTVLTSSASPATFAIGAALPDGEYTLRLAAGNPECGEETAEMTITVGGAPTVEVVAQPDYCGPTAVTLSASYAGTDRLTWEVTDATGALVFRSDVADAPTLNLEPGIYAVAASAASSCGTTVSRDTFRIFAEPVADLRLSADELCLDAGNTLTVVNGSADDALSYVWTVSPAGVSIDDDRAAAPTFTFAGEGLYTISAEIRNPSCAPITWSQTVEVRIGVNPVLTYQDRFCEVLDLTPVINYGGGVVDSVRWTFPGSEGNLTSGELYPSSVPYRTPGTYVYGLTVYSACGEIKLADTIHLDAMPTLAMGGRDTVCILDGVYALPAPAPAGGVWTDADGRTGIVTADGDFDPVAAGPGLTTLEYTFTDGACSTTGTREVFVIEKPEVAVAEPVLDVCETETYFVLNNGNPTGGWYEGPGVVDPSGVMDPSTVGAGTYTLTYHYRPAGMTCTGSVDFTVNVRPGPLAAISAPDFACVGEPVTFRPAGSGAVRYLWRTSDDPPVREESPVFTFTTQGIHTVTLTAYNAFGCPSTVVKQIHVTGVPVARFEKEQDEACDDVPFTFYNNSQVFGDASYLWDFGNGRTSNRENPEPVLFERGAQDTTYLVSLTVTNDCGTHTFSEEVTITTEPVADFTLSETDGCSQLNVTFENRTAGTRNRYKWFVNGELYSVAANPPSRSFIAEGTQNARFDIMLVAYNACGSDTLTRTVISKPNELRVRFSADERTGCDPFTVQFRNYTSPDSLVNYTWTFGDGYSSDEREPEHTFRNTTPSVKVYNVTLVADNGCAREELTLPVTVYPSPDVSFEIASATCVGDSVFFRNTSGKVTDLVWDFGDGTIIRDRERPAHVFPGAGEYTVTLSAKVEGADCPGVFTQVVTIRPAPQVDLTADNVIGCPPLQVDLQNLTETGEFFRWNFGDGNTAVGAAPGTHTYTTPGTYEITLTVRDEFGCSNDAVFSSVEVHEVPEVTFEAEAAEACGVPQTVCFTNGTFGASGYAWDFGNGVTSGLTSPCMTYTEAGTYDVTLTATNEYLCSASASAPLSIYGKPVAEFSVPDTAACAAGELPFTSTSQNTDFITWSFSDGYVSEEANFSRRFDEPGFYDVTVIAGNGSGCADTSVFTNFVEVYPRPVADFTFENAEGEPMNTIQFYDRSSADAVYFGWDFGDGYRSDEMDPVHRYLTGFDKTVRHWVENDYGCLDTAEAKVNLEMLVGLFVPNIFTPDDNTVEEQNVFKPKGIGLEDFYIAVYTRTGQLVWESNAIDGEGSPVEAWDGTFQGRPAKPGTYVWRVHRAKFRNGRAWTGMANEKGTIAKTGYVTLLR